MRCRSAGSLSVDDDRGWSGQRMKACWPSFWVGRVPIVAAAATRSFMSISYTIRELSFFTNGLDLLCSYNSFNPNAHQDYGQPCGTMTTYIWRGHGRTAVSTSQPTATRMALHYHQLVVGHCQAQTLRARVCVCAIMCLIGLSETPCICACCVSVMRVPMPTYHNVVWRDVDSVGDEVNSGSSQPWRHLCLDGCALPARLNYKS